MAKGRKRRKETTFPLPRLTTEERRTTEARVRTHSIIDYLYRLRVKTNYEDAAMFTDGPTDETASRKVHRELCFNASATLLVHELHVAEIVGRDHVRPWAKQWLKRNNVAGKLGLARRVDLL